MTKCNGYKIKFNSYWGLWQVTKPGHPGYLAERSKLSDAIEFCLNVPKN